jgi:hypothetical protein
MLATVDAGDGIQWYGMDVVNASNNRPGRREQAGIGASYTYGRDRHTRIEPAALQLLFRCAGHVVW